jgi:hypothetical protein
MSKQKKYIDPYVLPELLGGTTHMHIYSLASFVLAEFSRESSK